MFNKKNFILSIILVLSINTCLFGQQAVYVNSFNPSNQYETSSGIIGTALNLTESAKYRKIITVKNKLKGSNSEFSVLIWVKAVVNSDSNYEILSTIPPKENEENGWTIGMHANGAWYWIAEGRGSYKYFPTAQRQSIKDGKWHLLAFTFSNEKDIVHFYYDGLNTAIYYVPYLDSLNGDSLYIGGRQFHEFEDRDSFNGCIDDLRLFNHALSSDYILKYYNKFSSLKKVQTHRLISDTLKVMTFNIRHGGHTTGRKVGVQRIVDVIKSSGADIISMQETYGSGSQIADELGYYFYLRSSNLSIMSKYPIVKTLKGYKPFNNGGIYIELNKNDTIAFFTNWFTYPVDYWYKIEHHLPINVDTLMKKVSDVTGVQIQRTLHVIKPYIKDKDNIPVIFCGDFNSGSNLDYTEATRKLNRGYIFPFPTSKVMLKWGFHDSYREVHPNPLKYRGITWSPMFHKAYKERIDFIYYMGEKLKAIKSKAISYHPVRYPSDHAAVLTVFKLTDK